MTKAVKRTPKPNNQKSAQPKKKGGLKGFLKRNFNFTTFDFPLFIIVLILLVFGIVMMFSASYAKSYSKYDGNSYYFATRQIEFVVGGIIVMLVASITNYHFFYNNKVLFISFLGGIGLLIAVLLVGDIRNGAQRWLDLGFIDFQPSDVMKFVIIIVFAALVSRNTERMKDWKFILFLTIILGIVLVLMYKQPHLSGMIIMAIIAATIVFVGGLKESHTAVAIVLGIIAIIGIIKFSDGYFDDRFIGFNDPFADTGDKTFQTYQSLLTIGSGGFFGVGLGNSRQKYFLPEPHNDFVFSIICEELGFVGAITVIILFLIFIFRGFYIASKATDKFGMLVAAGITVQIGIQALMNIAVVSNAMPNTGISLPFFSYGGTALIMQLAEVGVLLNISRQSAIE